jgi:hypothetical protein
MTDTTARRMTADEIALMRAIVVWRRAEGVDFWRARDVLGRFVQWSAAGRGALQVSVDLMRGDDGPYALMQAGRKGVLGGIKLADDYGFTQAVDMLVALGYLPARFSSAYRAGWNAAHACLDASNEEISDVEFALEPRP